MQDVQVGFRAKKHKPSLGFTEDEAGAQFDEWYKDKMIEDPNSTRTLLSAANHFILNTKEDMIQNKIRQLLVGTELEEIAKQAQIVIHIQDDAKDFLREKIVEQREKIESNKIF